MADGTVLVELDFDDAKYLSQLREAGNKSKKAGKKAGKSFGEGFTSDFKSVFTGVLSANVFIAGFQAIGSAAGSAITNLRNFSKATAEINSILPATNKLTKQTKNSFVELSKTFGTDASKQAKAFYSIVSAGVRGTSEQMRTLTVANKAATAGLVSVDDAATLLVSSVNAYSASGLTATEASDSLFVAVREGITTFGELQSSLGLVSALAASSGVSFSELTGTIATLTKGGISTSIAVTQLKGALSELSKPNPALAKSLGKVSLETNTLQEVIGVLREKTGGSAKELAKLFGSVEARLGVTSLISRFEDFTEILVKTENAAGATGAALSVIVTEDVDFQLKQMDSQLSSIGLTIATGILPVFNDMLDGFRTMGRFITSTDSPMQELQKQSVKAEESVAVMTETLAIYNKRLAASEAATKAGGAIGYLYSVFGSPEDLKDQATLQEFELVDAKKRRDEILKQIKDATPKTQAELRAERDAAALEREKATALASEELAQTRADKDTERVAKLQSEAATISNIFMQLSEGQKQMVDGNSQNVNAFQEQAMKMSKTAKEMAADISKTMMNGLVRGLSNGFQAMGAAFVNGENAMKAFAGAMLSMIGDIAIQLGTSFIAQGIAHSLDPKTPGIGLPLIGAGAALVTVGGAIKALGGGGGGGGGSAAGSPSGGGSSSFSGDNFNTGSTVTEQIEDERVDPATNVSVVIQGDVLDSSESGLKIVELINDAFDKSGVVINSQAAV